MNTIVYRLILIAAWEAREVEKSEQAGGDVAREIEQQVSREEGRRRAVRAHGERRGRGCRRACVVRTEPPPQEAWSPGCAAVEGGEEIVRFRVWEGCGLLYTLYIGPDCLGRVVGWNLEA